MKILIIGAGPTGLTAALEFARQGIIPEIVDAKEVPSILSRAVGILPRSLEILNRTGVGQKLVAEGIRADRIHIKRDGKSLIEVNFADFVDEDRRMIGLPQDRTETLMSEKLAELGVTVKYNIKVQGVATTDDVATVTFGNGETKEYDWVIGADGVKSTVRESLGIPYEGYELEEVWSIADIEIKNPEFDATEFRAWLLPGERDTRDALVMVPIGKDRVRLVSSTPDSIKALPLDLDIREIRRSGTFKISVRQAKQYVQGRVILAGDAAHTHSPVGGRGMNLGIEDGAMAVEAILNNTLAWYEKTRKAKATRIIRWTERARKIIVSSNAFTVCVMKTAAWCLRHSRYMKKRFVERVLKS